MKRTTANAILAAWLGLSFLNCAGNSVLDEENPAPQPSASLAQFASASEAEAYLQDVVDALNESNNDSDGYETTAASEEAGETAAADSDSGADATNNQEDGVDEGGIVKSHGDHLLILREGRLASVRLDGAGGMELVSNLSVVPDGLDDTAWYDELLVSGDTAIVIGYRWHDFGSYAHGLTELDFFSVGEDGSLTRAAAKFFKSSDYYSGTNYASRLVDGKLVVYMPFYAYAYRDGKWVLDLPYLYDQSGRDIVERESLLENAEVYLPLHSVSRPVLHALVSCKLADPENLDCSSRVAIGSYARQYYAGRNAAYLWLGADYGNDEENAVLSLPWDSSATTAVRTSVRPIDQFSFDETEAGLDLFGYKSAEGSDGYWDSVPALATIPTGDFSEAAASLASERYREFSDAGYVSRNRFSATHLAFGGESLAVYDRATGATTSLEIGEPSAPETYAGLSRLESVDGGFIALSYVEFILPCGTTDAESDEDDAWEDSDSSSASSAGGSTYSVTLRVNAVSTSGTPAVTDNATLDGTYESEWRSHGFNAVTDDGETLFAFSVLDANDASWWEQASLAFFTLSPDGTLAGAGEISPVAFAGEESPCETSCVDWYGNTRAVFLGDAVYGLMGDQLSAAFRDADGAVVPVSHLNVMTGESLVETAR